MNGLVKTVHHPDERISFGVRKELINSPKVGNVQIAAMRTTEMRTGSLFQKVPPGVWSQWESAPLRRGCCFRSCSHAPIPCRLRFRTLMMITGVTTMSKAMAMALA